MAVYLRPAGRMTPRQSISVSSHSSINLEMGIFKVPQYGSIGSLQPQSKEHMFSLGLADIPAFGELFFVAKDFV